MSDSITSYIKSENGKNLLTIKGARVLVWRYVNMDEKTKELITKIFQEITGEDPSRVMKFLNFESDENEFCS